MPAEDPRLARLTEICLALPEATREVSGEHASFQVRKKTFVWFLSNHHGDGIVSVCCKMALGENEEMVESKPEKFYLPAYIAHRGWESTAPRRQPELPHLLGKHLSRVGVARSPGTTARPQRKLAHLPRRRLAVDSDGSSLPTASHRGRR